MITSDNSESLLELIVRAQEIAEREDRATAAYYLGVAADAVSRDQQWELERSVEATNPQPLLWSVQRWFLGKRPH
jgi:hypothetical protein